MLRGSLIDSEIVPQPRSFDPNAVGGRECQAWVAYYRREWGKLLVASVGLVQAGFGMRWWPTLKGAWLVLRANQLWAPHPDNDPDGARRCMERFYRLVAAEAGESLDTVEAARLEVEWWRLHRERQHRAGNGAHDDRAGNGAHDDRAGNGAHDDRAGNGAHDDRVGGRDPLVDSLADLYAFVYSVERSTVTAAAALRAEAMDVSDRWVAEGCSLASPLLREERALLVRSYAALLAAVHR